MWKVKDDSFFNETSLGQLILKSNLKYLSCHGHVKEIIMLKTVFSHIRLRQTYWVSSFFFEQILLNGFCRPQNWRHFHKTSNVSHCHIDLYSVLLQYCARRTLHGKKTTEISTYGQSITIKHQGWWVLVSLLLFYYSQEIIIWYYHYHRHTRKRNLN